ncbi:MAG: FAD-dependent oxidoreductase [Actinomycetota bacterium]
MSNPDVIVIGAGMIGATIALKISDAGLKVLVLDQSSISGGTTSSGEGNILVSDKEVGPELTLALHSRNAWFELVEKSAAGCELEAKGGVVVVRSEEGRDHLNFLVTNQKSVGVVAEELDQKELREMEPHLSEEITFGVHYPQDSQCQPMLTVGKILSFVRKLGGTVVTGAKVEGLLSDAQGITGVKTAKGSYFSRVVVSATGV